MGRNFIYTDEQLINTVPNVYNISHLMKELGFQRRSSTSVELINQKISDYNLDISHWIKPKRITDRQLKDIIKKSFNWSEVLKKLGYGPRGGIRTNLQRRAKKLNIDISHFDFNRKIINPNNPERIKRYKDYLGDKRIRYHLLIERGHKCELCENNKWGDEEIPLELHHIDLNHTNNTKENLILVCSTCHRWIHYKEGKRQYKKRTKEWSEYKCNKSLRCHYLNEIGKICEKCGITSWLGTNIIPLHIHHIDENKKNNSFDNLICLCPNCHSLEHEQWYNNKK